MKVSILIVTYGKDFHWLKWCLKSIEKFSTGFHELVVAIPMNEPWEAVQEFCNEYDGPIPLRLHPFDEWPDKGFLHHMSMIMKADLLCPSADFILHLDPDCIFCEPVTPDDYFVEGKPVLMYASYHWITRRFNPWNLPPDQSYFMHWKRAVEAAIGGQSENEFMRRHPAIHYRKLYQEARNLIEQHQGVVNADIYIIEQKNTFPQTFAEFPTLGEVAWRLFKNWYHWVNQETVGRPHDKLIEFWSHGPIDQLQELTWTDAPNRKFVPIEVIKKLLT